MYKVYNNYNNNIKALISIDLIIFVSVKLIN